MFREYISLSGHGGLIELCDIYQKIVKDFVGNTVLLRNIKPVLLGILKACSQLETGLALVKTYLAIELHSADAHNDSALSYLYSSITDEKSHFIFISVCCDVIGEQALKYPARINEVLLALNECLKKPSAIVKASACDAIAYLADAINADGSYQNAVENCIESLQPLCWDKHVIIKIKAYKVLGRLVKFLPEDSIDSIIDNCIEALSKPDQDKHLNAGLCAALTGFLPFMKYDSSSDNSPKKILLKSLIGILNSSDEEQEARAALKLLSELALSIPEILMAETIAELIQLFHSGFTAGKKRSLEAVTLLAPYCSQTLRSKIATHTLRQLTNDDGCQLAQAALKSLNPLTPETQHDSVLYILDRLFRLENLRHAAAMTVTLIDLTEDCAQDLMLAAIKRTMTQLKVSNKLHTARNVLFKLADSVSKTEKYAGLKAHFVNEYIKCQSNREALSSSYFTYVSIIAKFYDKHVKANLPRSEIENVPRSALRHA